MNDKTKGACFLIYGPYESGKTYSFGSLIEPAAVINTEPRDIRRVLAPFLDKRDIDIFVPPPFDPTKPQKWYEWQLNKIYGWENEAIKGKLKYRSIAYDSFSYSLNEMKTIVEDAQHIVSDQKEEWKSEEEKTVSLIGGKKSKDSGYVLWNTIGGTLVRITKGLNKLSQYGIYIIGTAISEKDSYPARPFFQGNIYSNAYGGYFDFIGHVFSKSKIHNLYELGETKDKFPPYVMFISPDEEFEAKCCDTKLREKLMKQKGPYAPLDFTKIIKSMDVK